MKNQVKIGKLNTLKNFAVIMFPSKKAKKIFNSRISDGNEGWSWEINTDDFYVRYDNASKINGKFASTCRVECDTIKGAKLALDEILEQAKGLGVEIEYGWFPTEQKPKFVSFNSGLKRWFVGVWYGDYMHRIIRQNFDSKIEAQAYCKRRNKKAA